MDNNKKKNQNANTEFADELNTNNNANQQKSGQAKNSNNNATDCR